MVLSGSGCAKSGPVTSELKDAYTKVNEPKGYQDPQKAIQLLEKHLQDWLATAGRKKLTFGEEVGLAIAALQFMKEEQAREERTLETQTELSLKPGHSYSFRLQSFCVHAGKDRPIAGDGFRVGPMKGPAAAWLPDIINKYKGLHISQDRTQVLIWALLAGARFDDLDGEEKADLLRIFPNAAIRFGNRRVENQMQSLFSQFIPSYVQNAMSEYENVRAWTQTLKGDYDEIARIMAPMPFRTEPIPMGWGRTSSGIETKAESLEGYSSVQINLFLSNSAPTSVPFRPADMIAIPSRGQRLAISGNKAENDPLSRLASSGLDQVAPQKLTQEEKNFIREHPIDAAQIYINSLTAIDMTSEIFPNGEGMHNGSADAFRHFSWAALNAQSVGVDQARAFMVAHEQKPGEPMAERDMDLSNNEKGFAFMGEAKGRQSDQQISDAAWKAVNSGKLKVLMQGQ